MADGGGEPAAVVRLHPIRTLVIASDLAFRRRAATILADLGEVLFAFTGGRPDEVVELTCERRPDVLVLDVTARDRAVVAAVVDELQLRAPRTRIVLVSSAAEDLRLPVVAKWGWACDLMQAVREAYHRPTPLCEEAGIHAT